MARISRSIGTNPGQLRANRLRTNSARWRKCVFSAGRMVASSALISASIRDTTLRAPPGAAVHAIAKATCGTIRVKLLKIGALVRTSVRRITLAMASSYPYQRDFAVAHAELTNATAR